MGEGVVSSSTPVRTWSTSGLPESEQFPFWRDVVCEAFMPVSLSRRQDGPFVSSVSTRRIGAIEVSRIRSQPQSVVRTESQVERDPGHVFFLNLPLTPGTAASQAGRATRLAAGDFVLVDGARSFGLEFERPFDQVSLTLPHELLAPFLAAPHDVTAVRVPGQYGVGAVAAGTLQSLAAASGSFDRHTARALGDQIAGLVALALGGARTPVRSSSRAILLQAALDRVERELSNPELSPPVVAGSIGVSTRYLHQLFADRGTSFGRWVLARRLERCHRDLSDPARAHWTITRIALDNGFRDPAYFARAFKRHYGTTPRGLRKLAAASSPSAADRDR